MGLIRLLVITNYYINWNRILITIYETLHDNYILKVILLLFYGEGRLQIKPILI